VAQAPGQEAAGLTAPHGWVQHAVPRLCARANKHTGTCTLYFRHGVHLYVCSLSTALGSAAGGVHSSWRRGIYFNSVVHSTSNFKLEVHLYVCSLSTALGSASGGVHSSWRLSGVGQPEA
jgi:hypothetical protein